VVSAEVDIANLALQFLGEPVITTMTEVSRDAEICNQLYAQNRDYCLMLTPWACVTHRAVLERAGKVAISGATAADPVVVTCTGHVFVANELVTIESVTGMTQLNDNRYRIYSYTSTSLTLYDTDGTSTAGTAFTAWVSGGYVYRDSGQDWSYVYDLPSTALFVQGVLDSEGGEDDEYIWRKERQLLYCNVVNAGVKYLKKETDPSLYESDIVELMATRLAWLVSMRIHSDKRLRDDVYREHNNALARARLSNASGKHDGDPPETSWTEVW